MQSVPRRQTLNSYNPHGHYLQFSEWQGKLRSRIRSNCLSGSLFVALLFAPAWLLPPTEIIAADAPPAASIDSPAPVDSASALYEANIPLSPERGYEILTTKRFLPPDFDEDVLDSLWTVWPEPERAQVASLASKDRRRAIFEYYGLMADPADAFQPLGYIHSDDGSYTMNCLACHGGQVRGNVIPGLPNSNFALQTLTEDARQVKLALKKPLSHLDLGTLRFPLGMTNGSTNAVIFGVLLGALRNPDMSIDTHRSPPHVVHHDADAIPYWQYHRKPMLYADGFAPRSHRPLMQFVMLPQNGRETLYNWERDFEQIATWIDSTRPPKYDGPIDAALAKNGEALFNKTCARCHGTYGATGTYVEQIIPIDEVGTDRVRLDALTPEHRRWMKTGWLSNYGQEPVVIDPGGYVAPPLDGIWASAPYFHNGSVPTLWHVLHPDERPALWKRSPTGYDDTRAGLEVEVLDEIPRDQRVPSRRRRIFDTSIIGKGNGGHRFPDELTEDEKTAVLEYLKTL